MGELDALQLVLPAASLPAGDRHAETNPRKGHRQVHPLRPATLDAIGATAAQKARIDEIVQQASTDLAIIGARRQLLNQQELTLRAQPNVDVVRLQAIQAQQMRLADASSARWQQAIDAAARVLTPAQRAAIEQLGP